MKITKISEQEFNKENQIPQVQIIKQYNAKVAPANLLKGINIVAEFVIEVPFNFLESVIMVLRSRDKKYMVYPRPDSMVIAVKY